MEKLLFIAEKPSLMRECMKVYAKNKSKIPYNIDFTALSGHVCCFENPKTYSEWDKKWSDIKLPMVPKDWKIGIIADKKTMFSDIQKLIKNSSYDGFICGTDADREGNLIYYLFSQKIGIAGKKTYRFWVHDLTDKGIMDAFNTLSDMKKDKKQINLTEASILRSKFDWLVGMNFTISATTHSGQLMKIGRVKTPTLKIVYDNCMAIDGFKSTTSYEIESQYSEGFSGFSDERYNTEAEAKKIILSLSKTAKVESVDTKKVSTSAPQLYKLSDLQIDASKAYGYTPEKTLKLVQVLYEKHKLVSYPRTDCRHISTALAKDFPTLLNAVAAVDSTALKVSKSDMEAVKKVKKYVNDAEVGKSSHTALMPTGIVPKLGTLDKDEINILIMIYKRFLAIFLPPLIEEKTVVVTKNDGNGMLFKSNGKVILDPGYTKIYSTKLENNPLPALKKGQTVNVKSFKVNEKTTNPPARLTEGTLIKEMENISKRITDKELKDVMSEAAGIGTPATRGAIIESLLKDGYMEARKTKKTSTLYITDMGKQYIENLLSFSIVSPELTAEWEKKLREIESGEMKASDFETQMLKFINSMSSELSSVKMKHTSPYPTSSTGATGTPVAKCPKCGKTIVETPKAYSCSNSSCGCVIFKDDKYFKAMGKKMTKSIAKTLFEKGSVKVTGCKSKSGKTYDAIISVSFDSGKYPNYSMSFDDSTPKSKPSSKTTKKKSKPKK